MEQGSSRSSRSVLFGAVVAIMMVAATLTFGSGLATLVSHPALFGWNWNDALDSSAGYGPVPPKTQALLSRDPDVARWTGVSFFVMEIDGVETPVLFADAPASISPPILTGHALDAPNEIVLGPATLAALHRRIGRSVRVSYGPPTHSESKSLSIVGTSTLPAIGISEGLHTSMGVGALVPEGAFPNFSEQGYPAQCNGPNMALVRFRSGVSASEAKASLETIAKSANREFAHANNSCGLIVSVIGVQKPGEIRDYGSAGLSPILLASGLAGGAVVALVFTLFASVRTRRREYALLKVIGFTRRQVAAAVAWQATVAGAVGVVVGLPLGIVLGRWLWILFARDVYAVPDATVPRRAMILVSIGALALVNLVAALPGRRAARTPMGQVLREE